MKFNFDLEDVKYVKILYEGEHSSPNTIKAELKKITSHEISACAKFEEDVIIRTPQDVTLSVVCNNGLYRTKTKLKSVEADAPYLFFYLELPEGMEYHQNREYFRISADYKCVCYIKQGDNVVDYTTKTFDISANGVSVILPERLFSENEAEIDLMIDERFIHSNIKYVRSEDYEGVYKVSYAFDGMAQSDQDYISKVCLQAQMQKKRDNII